MSDAAGDASRQAIVDALRSRGGGTHKRELCRLTGKGWGTIGHHVYVLAKGNAVTTEVHGRHLWVFLPGLGKTDRDWLVAMRTASRRRILDYLLASSPKTINALSDEMAMSRKVIRTHLQHLQRYGAVDATGGYPPQYVPAKTSEEKARDPPSPADLRT